MTILPRVLFKYHKLFSKGGYKLRPNNTNSILKFPTINLTKKSIPVKFILEEKNTPNKFYLFFYP